MARYTGPVCRLCRAEGVKLFLKGAKCLSDKCPLEQRHTRPGQHGRIPQRKISPYGRQLREKQKVKRFYGVLERQFRRYFEMAERMRGKTGDNLLILLERRLDNVIYRMGFAYSRRHARQLVNHRHFKVNGRNVDIPSYLVREGDVIEFVDRSKNNENIKAMIEDLMTKANPPSWIEVDWEGMKGRIIALPTREDVSLPVEEHLIVELYSK